MKNTQFPRTTIGGISVSRMIMGTNWILGFSHRGNAVDEMIKKINSTKKAQMDILEAFVKKGVDTIMAPFELCDSLVNSIRTLEDKTGKEIIMIDTPVINMSDNTQARKEAECIISNSKKRGATFCFPHHSSVEMVLDREKQSIRRLPDYLYMIREQGLIPGLSAHMPEVILFSDLNEYDVETYIQIYNCAGFLMQVEVEAVNKIIWDAKKPVITIKSMAAGRVTPFVGLSFSYSTIRPQDMVAVGCMTPMEVEEDIEIALAAIERRRVDLTGRNSPNKTIVLDSNHY